MGDRKEIMAGHRSFRNILKEAQDRLEGIPSQAKAIPEGRPLFIGGSDVLHFPFQAPRVRPVRGYQRDSSSRPMPNIPGHYPPSAREPIEFLLGLQQKHDLPYLPLPFSHSALKTTYRQLALRVHPDHGPKDPESILKRTETFRRLRDAFDSLISLSQNEICENVS